MKMQPSDIGIKIAMITLLLIGYSLIIAILTTIVIQFYKQSYIVGTVGLIFSIAAVIGSILMTGIFDKEE